MMLYIVLLMITILYFLYRLKNARKYRLAKQFTGPTEVPILGNTLIFKKRTPKEVLTYFQNASDEYGSIYRIWMGTRLAFVVTDPKVCEIVFSNSTKFLEKSSLYDFLVPWLGTGLLLSAGQKWHSRRKIITPAFHFKILEEFCVIFDAQSEILLNNLKKHEHGDAFDVTNYISLMALDVVCETAMGIKLNAQTDAESSYVKAVHELTRIISTRLATIWQRNDFLFNLFAREMRIKQDAVIKRLHLFTKNIINRRRAQLIQELESNEKSDRMELGGKQALLDILLQSTTVDGKSLSNEDIREEVDTFTFEGHDTTTSGICFTLYLISRHPDVQNKIFAEIQDVFGSKTEKATYRKLQDLKYLDMVIKEALRIFPPVPIIGRKIEEDLQLHDGRIVPANSTFTINFFLMFRDPKLHPNPLQFNPDRFMSDNAMDSFFSYTPFSAGSRNCIGQKFAMLELKSSISKILRSYELLPVGEEPIPVMELILRSENGVQLGLKPRLY
ncbi:cytochrome P450 4d2-like [Bradysia coprophila]|uniref:cytochrome P450 4d2-like n=1 Tax=Bradysia coprophila TaxID=38358 RepID=UPI00187DC439|nr:cytochrome P450 4d2-like [Bradysia coprophila]